MNTWYCLSKDECGAWRLGELYCAGCTHMDSRRAKLMHVESTPMPVSKPKSVHTAMIVMVITLGLAFLGLLACGMEAICLAAQEHSAWPFIVWVLGCVLMGLTLRAIYKQLKELT